MDETEQKPEPPKHGFPALRWAIAKKRGELERAKETGASEAEIKRLTGALEWLEGSLKHARPRG